jgi:hypothetical protein
MLQYSVDASSVIEYLVAIDERIKASLIKRIDLVTEVLVDRLHGNLTGLVLQERTGRLFRSVQRTPASFDGTYLLGATVTAATEDASYGAIFETGGTHAFNIIPTDSRVLMFMMEGKAIFATRVVHPPIPQMPWFAPEVAWAEKAMDSQINQAIKEAL